MSEHRQLRLDGVRHVSEVVGAIVAEARGRGYSEERCADLRTALSEACLNAFEHASKGSAPPTLGVAWQGGQLSVTVSSDGPPFEIPESKPDLLRKLDGDASPRGWGLFLIRSLSDAVDVRSLAGRNTLQMVFTNRSTEGNARHD